ncbi:pre-toxin TG domain-containing protein [Geobacillus icigianus]|nr:EndoU domain-containing protein [Geobacillus subterraneus]
MIRLRPDELETVAKHIPDAEDACQRARTTLSRELSSLAMDLPGVSTPAIEALRDELIHWLRCYEEKLNEAEELLYRTAAAMRQADQTLADNMKEFGLELLGWYDVQRVFGEYDPITGERFSVGDRLLAGGMLLASIAPPAKGVGVAGKAVITEARMMDAVSALVKVKHVVRDNKMKSVFQTIYQQVIKAPLVRTIRLFKKQCDNLMELVPSVFWQPSYAGVGSPTSALRVWIDGSKDASLRMIEKVEGEMVGRRAIEAKFSSTLEKHIKHVDPNVPRKRGIGGAHNKNEFMKSEINILEVKKHEGILGVEKITYQIPSLDPKTGQRIGWKEKIFQKTVYDPKMISDEEFIKRGKEAANDAAVRGALGREWEGYDGQGIKWRGYTNENGEVTSFYPEL